MSTITGAFDNEGTAIVRAALSLLDAPTDGDNRTRGQRNADASVGISRFALGHHDRPVGSNRRPPKVDVAVPDESLLTRAGIGPLDDHVITADAARRRGLRELRWLGSVE